jgi:hypothetical protein
MAVRLVHTSCRRRQFAEKIARYRYRGTKIPTPWAPQPVDPTQPSPDGTHGEPDAVKVARPVREGGTGKQAGENTDTAPRADPHPAHQSCGQRPPLRDPDQPIDLTAVIKRRATVAGLIHEYRRAA